MRNPEFPIDPLADPTRGAHRMWLPVRQESLTVQALDEGGGSGATAAQELLWVLWRSRWLVLACVAGGAIAGFLYSQASPPIYRARATVEIQSFNENFLNVRDMDPTGGSYSDDSYFQTQVRIFEGAAVHRRTADELLAKLPPEPADTAQLPWWKSMLHINQAPLSPRRAVKMAASNVKVRPIGKARLVEITTSSTDPGAAGDFLNKLTDAFIEQNLKLRWESAQRTSEWLSRQLDDLRQNLAKSERALQDYTRNAGLVLASGTSGEAQLRDFQQQLSKADAERAAKQARYEQAKSRSADALPEIMDDGAFRAQNAKLEDLRIQLAEANATLTPEHYRVKRLESQVREVEAAMAANKARVLDRIRQEHDASVRNHELLRTAYADEAQRIAGQAERLAQYNVLKQDVQTTRVLYDSLLQRVRESGIASALRASNVRVVEPASAPAAPDGPHPVQSTGLGLTAGLLAGLVLVFGRERLERGFLKAPGEAPAYLQVPELGVIPNESVDDHAAKLALSSGNGSEFAAPQNGSEHERVELVTWQRKRSLLAESFRGTLTSILFAGPNPTASRVLVVTSPNPREGKTVISGNLAVALVEIGRRTLLIDGDLRGPRLHKLFDLPNSFGLSDLVNSTDAIEGCPVMSLVRATKIPGLFLLPSGPAPMSVPNLLHSHRLAALLRAFRTEFDCVLIDTPPMLHLTDARIVARMADGVLLVLRSGVTTREQAQSAVQRLADDGSPMLGTILNDWDPRSRPPRSYANYSEYYYARGDR